jgi:hypothetical protein
MQDLISRSGGCTNGYSADVTTRIKQDDEATRLRADIARTRANLAQSVDALTARLDVPGRARDAAARRAEPVRRLAGAAVTTATKARGAAVTTAAKATGVAVTTATKATGVAVATASKATGVAWDLARDGIGIGVALTRWGVGSVARVFTRGG